MTSTICPKCNEETLPDQLVCLKCGTLLFNPSISTMHMRIDPKLLRLRRKRIQSPAPVELEHAVTLYIRGLVERLIFEEDTEIVLGRFDPNNPNDQCFDLTRYGARERGVSREHALLRFTNSQLTITDLNSVNGTMVNLKRLAPNQSRVLRDGDEVTLGTLAITFRIDVDAVLPAAADDVDKATKPNPIKFVKGILPSLKSAGSTKELSLPDNTDEEKKGSAASAEHPSEQGA